MDEVTARTYISDLRAVGISPISRAARSTMQAVWQTRLAERVRLRNTSDDQLNDRDQAARRAILEEDRLREVHAAAFAVMEPSWGNDTDIVEPIPAESRRSSGDWDSHTEFSDDEGNPPRGRPTLQIFSGLPRTNRERRERLRERLLEEADLCVEDARRAAAYIRGITQRRENMLAGMTTLPVAPDGFCYIEDDESVYLAQIEEDGSLGSTIYVGRASDSHPPQSHRTVIPGDS
ncbi:hypothetical protein C8R44DRAFT_892366 [Mycena epipterygia]|nr:hypothetical protein C8R44DRAFT_892366 [Mycena epipterygia]